MGPGERSSLSTRRFPWPALCEEVRKLKIGLCEGQVLDGDFGTCYAPRYSPANRAKSLAKGGDPSGIRRCAKQSETEVAPTENRTSGSVTHILARRGCSKCSKAAHLAVVAANVQGGAGVSGF
jgi:hypothetical protein